MNYNYRGIVESKRMLQNLASDLILKTRIGLALIEIDVINETVDVSSEHFKRLHELKDKYYSLETSEDEKQLIEISTSLVDLCVEIIEHNASNSNK